MTKDDVICIASKAGLTIGTNMSGIALVGSPAEIGIAHITLDEMHHFADIVATAERKAIAEMVSNCSLRATPKGIAAAIRTRGLINLNKEAEKNGEEL
jgi:hypothetical protein